MEFSTVAIGVLISIELGYFVKAFIYTVGSRWLTSKIHPLASSKIYGICSTRDVDFMLNHINNSRYLRAMDFGRLDHIVRSRILTFTGKDRPKLLVAASTIRYRKPVYIFMPYRLVSQIVYWDEKNIYYKQNFETIHDNFLRVTGYVKVAVIGASPQDLLTKCMSESVPTPEVTEDLAYWIKYLKSNSDCLKKLR
ncbi:protein THEM6-like [Palaemon carinicauda]|uniref:protein THEM6-like n=1 Tax=Palaemon carinicauda TaxID=392227 RepID=UPI0035B590A4